MHELLPIDLRPTTVEPHPDGGLHAEWHFPNGWGASVIPARWRDCVELAVTRDDGNERWPLDYTTEVTSDVRIIDGPAELIKVLTTIRNGPRIVRCCPLYPECDGHPREW